MVSSPLSSVIITVVFPAPSTCAMRSESCCSKVQIVPQDAVTASQKRAIEALLEGQLQLGPECIKWNSPSGEDVL